MKAQQVILLAIIGCLLTACKSKIIERHITDWPVNIRQEGVDSVDFDLVYSQAYAEVKKYLPDAVFHSVVYSGGCSDSLMADGKIVLTFTEIHDVKLLPQPKIYVATAEINISTSTMDISISDMTDYYPSMRHYPIPTNSDFQRIISEAVNHLKELRAIECKMFITQMGEKWDVSCNSSNINQCRLEFDAETFQVIPSSNNIK